MKKLLLLSLLLIGFCSYGQQKVYVNPGDSILVVAKQGTTPPVDTCSNPCKDGEDGKTPIVTTSYSVVPYNNPPKAINQPNAQGVNVHFELPSAPPQPTCPNCPPSGGGGSGNQQAYKIFNVMDFGAKGDGVTDDQPAFQRAKDAAIANNGGKIEIPPPANFYRFNNKWNIQGGAQIWIDIEMWGCRRGSGIVYMGGNNNAIIEIVGLKAGRIKGIKAKVGNGSTNVDCMRIGTNGSSGSTAGFTVENVEVEVGTGVNNRGFVTGFPEVGNGDVSQIGFINCTAWGMGGLGSAGQVGFANVGPNTLQITVVGGGVVHLQEGVRIERGGGMYFYGFGGSHVKEYFHILGATNLGVYGGRFEALAEKILRVDGSSNACTVELSSLILGNFRSPDGKIVVFDSPGTLIMDNFHMEESQASGPIVSLGGSGGAFHARGGSYNCTSEEMAQATAGWRQYIKGVRRMSNIGQATGWFNDK